MPECSRIDSLVTPFVDGELPAQEQQTVQRHLTACPPCRAKVAAERAIRALLQSRRTDLSGACAPAALKERCALLSSRHRQAAVTPFPVKAAAPGWRARLAPLALAAALVLAVGGIFLYQGTRGSSRLLAAELAMDHEKCFRLNHLFEPEENPSAVQASMSSWVGAQFTLPNLADHHDVSLVGSRPCLYGEGKVAHIMYRHRGRPVSLFMLPRETRQEQVVRIFGHEARMWSEGDRTFVLLAKESDAELDEMVSFVRASIR